MLYFVPQTAVNGHLVSFPGVSTSHKLSDDAKSDMDNSPVSIVGTTKSARTVKETTMLCRNLTTKVLIKGATVLFQHNWAKQISWTVLSRELS